MAIEYSLSNVELHAAIKQCWEMSVDQRATPTMRAMARRHWMALNTTRISRAGWAKLHDESINTAVGGTD